MIRIPAACLKAIVDAAEGAYPAECCGLLVGTSNGATSVEVSRVVASPNLADGNGNDRFEVDPQIRFNVMKELDQAAQSDGTQQRIIGHYHSHPNHPAQPSETDLKMAYEPDLIWIITSVVDGQATLTTAHCVDADRTQFRQIPLQTSDWQPYPVRTAP
ncbi:MAG: M67 family metallopeptidase [Rhodospirillales bacterium]|nr:M67 family metallopeptidase [Rhodospirillales bacterium]